MKNDTRTQLFKALGLLALTPIEFYWKGYVFSVLWAWFIAATFNLPELSVLSCIGLIIFIAYSKASFSDLKFLDSVKEKMGEDDFIAERLAFAFSYPLVLLGLGWVVHKLV